MEASTNGGGSNGVFAAAADANDGIMAAALTTTGQLRTTTAIATATIGQRSHCCQCHCIIAPPSQRHLHQQQLLSMKITIAAAAQTMVNGGSGLC
jgi:hypothetical protein